MISLALVDVMYKLTLLVSYLMQRGNPVQSAYCLSVSACVSVCECVYICNALSDQINF